MLFISIAENSRYSIHVYSKVKDINTCMIFLLIQILYLHQMVNYILKPVLNQIVVGAELTSISSTMQPLRLDTFSSHNLEH